MFWTSYRPKTLGWYWCRFVRYGEKVVMPVEVITIYKDSVPGVFQMTSAEVENEDTEWSETPIPVPMSRRSEY